MRPLSSALAAAAILLAAACNEHAPVLPTDAAPPGAPALIITLVSDRTSLDAGSQSPAMLTVTARQQDGSIVADGTAVALNTNIGHFGLGSDGKPQQLITTKTVAGAATVPFYAGDKPGTANVRAQVGTSVGQLNLAVGVPVAAPVADFAFTTAGLRALFADQSSGGAAKRLWTFGDGGESEEVSPVHDYANAGTYTVTLTLTNSSGQSVKSKFVTVPEGPPLVASFTAQPNGLTVLFTDTSTGNPNDWTWDFGDGSFATGQKPPPHVYGGAGTYAVTLTVKGTGGRTSSVTNFVTVGGDAPSADFTFETAGLRALFTDTSKGAKSWHWDYGDGVTEDNVQNPTHDYVRTGTYTVTLTVANAAGTSKKSKFVTISLGEPPKAAFTYKVEGLDVAFTDASTGAPTQWNWDFGDGKTSTDQNPSHHYDQGGTYTVKLTVTNAAGESTISQIVKVVGKPVADFFARGEDLTLTFFDTSTGEPTAWLWNFGDCNVQECTSTAQNPIHKYAAPGRYIVTLTVSNAAGQSSIQKVVTVSPPQAAFTASKAGLVVTFTNQSTRLPETFAWNFGDCATNPTKCTSAEKDPTHTYLTPGPYSVTLTASNAGGDSVARQSITVP